jgi:3-isopropylmalate/(R)-2-methylmalate dehydratase small subunit
MSGRVWIVGDDVDTDAIAPGAWMKSGIDVLAQHCLESLLPAFAREVRPGDVLVSGRNFGAGSSREQAPQALRHLGIAALVAPSYAGLFYRNALNLGLPALVCAAAGTIRPGDRLRIDPAAGRIEIAGSGAVLSCEPIPPHLLEMLDDGGLLPHLEKRLARERRTA